jgi:hypothetical protein
VHGVVLVHVLHHFRALEHALQHLRSSITAGCVSLSKITLKKLTLPRILVTKGGPVFEAYSCISNSLSYSFI